MVGTKIDRTKIDRTKIDRTKIAGTEITSYRVFDLLSSKGLDPELLKKFITSIRAIFLGDNGTSRLQKSELGKQGEINKLCTNLYTTYDKNNKKYTLRIRGCNGDLVSSISGDEIERVGYDFRNYDLLKVKNGELYDLYRRNSRNHEIVCLGKGYNKVDVEPDRKLYCSENEKPGRKLTLSMFSNNKKKRKIDVKEIDDLKILIGPDEILIKNKNKFTCIENRRGHTKVLGNAYIQCESGNRIEGILLNTKYTPKNGPVDRNVNYLVDEKDLKIYNLSEEDGVYYYEMKDKNGVVEKIKVFLESKKR